ncbi:hypothetical protein BV898_02494 [Hypsibius exemplaris]|uniref:SH2 domain-containing protein n=1 Tax=Hypsibius exemplaris TaxID=2072580 RepID=A0A1W0X8E4_HYPEX|nr:hypothetical protein BV898_02494 [Hypsibius exemplaris]
MEALPNNVKCWSVDELESWFTKAGMEDCLASLMEHDVTSGESLMSLTEEDVMAWTNLQFSRRRELAHLLRVRRTSKRETKIKGIFETLTRRRKSAPSPIPVDYGQMWVQPQQTGNQCVIMVDSRRDIRPRTQESINDWGSEFSDSDSEMDNSQNRLQSQPLTSARVDEIKRLSVEEELYELPEQHTEPEVAQQASRPCKIETLPRTSHLLSTKMVPSCNPTVAHRASGSRPMLNGVEGVRHSLSAREVAEKLEKLLANRNLPMSDVNNLGNRRRWSADKPESSSSLDSQYKCATIQREHGPVMNERPSFVARQVSLPAISSEKGMVRRLPESALPLPPTDDLDSFPWFHGGIDRSEARRRLENDATDGAFLIRKSRKGGEKFSNPYSLSLLSNGKVYHLTIRLRGQDGTFALGFEKPGEEVFLTVKDLVEHHLINPLRDFGESVISSYELEEKMKLKTPVRYG